MDILFPIRDFKPTPEQIEHEKSLSGKCTSRKASPEEIEQMLAKYDLKGKRKGENVSKVAGIMDNYVVIANPDLNKNWQRRPLELFKDLWNEGKSIFVICEKLNRPGEDVINLILYLRKKGELRCREDGLMGGKPVDDKGESVVNG